MKTEMVNAFNSSVVGGNLVQIDNKNRYHVTDKNGKTKVLTRDQFEKNIVQNEDKLHSGEDIKFKKPMSFFSKAMLTLLGAGAIAGIIYRKDILKFFKSSQTKEVIDNLVNSESGQKIKKTGETIKDTVEDVIKNPKTYAQKIDGFVAKWTEKGINGIGKVVDFIKGFKK